VTAVFSHGRLRLYLLKLLAEGPKHGYELIRLLENRFLGLYAPSAGTIYPRLARLEAKGLVTHTAAGGRKVYEITPAGRDELNARRAELATLESDIHASVADLTTLANDIEREVSGSVRDIKHELGEATRAARRRSAGAPWSHGRGWDWRGGWNGDDESGEARPGAGRSERRAGGDTAASLADLERAVRELAADAKRLARQAGANEAQLRAATAVVVSALTELRRVLGRR
jgi:DNA-binding PadR family transcriptional regulator